MLFGQQTVCLLIRTVQVMHFNLKCQFHVATDLLQDPIPDSLCMSKAWKCENEMSIQ